jgi:hypothetical protein
MGKSKGKSKSSGPQQRIRINPLTGSEEVVNGTKAGKRRNRLPSNHPLRTHDLHGESRRKKKGD